ncbi:hypothetical protein BH23CHL7_BH23CHL7_00740 [soil metagenome]
MSGTASSNTGRRHLHAVPERAPGNGGKGSRANGNRANGNRGKGNDGKGARAGADVPAGLRHVNADDPGMSRRRHGRGFTYRDADGERVTDEQALERIRSLAIPPAWTSVWICPSSRGHIQATGRDARGRKQYRYHPLWRQVRDASKYERTIAFGEALPGLRRHVERDLRRPGLDRQKVVAAVVRLLDATLLRVGNEEYARQNRTYGLTTLRDQHGRVGEVARWLGNTPAVCRSAYIHPAVLDAFEAAGWGQGSRHNRRAAGEQVRKPSVRRGLGADERELLNLLRRLQRRRAAA